MHTEEHTWYIEISNRPGVVDAVGDGICGDIADLGISGVGGVRFVRLYLLCGALSEADAQNAATRLLADPVTQDYRVGPDGRLRAKSGQWGIEVWLRPGVTDATGETTLKGIRDLGLLGIAHAATGRGYVLSGDIAPETVNAICRRLLANDVIEQYRYYPGTA